MTVFRQKCFNSVQTFIRSKGPFSFLVSGRCHPGEYSRLNSYEKTRTFEEFLMIQVKALELTVGDLGSALMTRKNGMGWCFSIGRKSLSF